MQTFHPSGWFLWPSFFSRQVKYIVLTAKAWISHKIYITPRPSIVTTNRDNERNCAVTFWVVWVSSMQSCTWGRVSHTAGTHGLYIGGKTAAEVCTLSYPVERKTNSFSFSLFWNQKQVITLCLLFFGRTHSRTSLREYFSVSHVKWNINNLLLF